MNVLTFAGHDDGAIIHMITLFFILTMTVKFDKGQSRGKVDITFAWKINTLDASNGL